MGLRYAPMAFTEQVVTMLSSVLKKEQELKMANFRNERSRALNVPLFNGGLRGISSFFLLPSACLYVGRSMFDVHFFCPS